MHSLFAINPNCFSSSETIGLKTEHGLNGPVKLSPAIPAAAYPYLVEMGQARSTTSTRTSWDEPAAKAFTNTIHAASSGANSIEMTVSRTNQEQR